MDELSSSLFQPVFVVALVAVVCFVVSQVLHSRDAHDRAERFADVGFAAALLGAVYVAVLFLISLVSEPDVLYDAALIILIVAVFFLVLLFLLFGVVELIFSRGERKAIAREGD